MVQKAALHGIGENCTQRCVYALHDILGERPSSFKADDFLQLRIQIAGVFRTELRQLIVSQRRQEAVDVLPVLGQGRLGQLAGSNGLQPQLRVFCQRNTPVHFFLRK